MGVAEVVAAEVLGQRACDVRMGEHCHLEFRCALEHRAELRIRDQVALDAAAELDRAEAVLARGALQFGDCGVDILHRQRGHAAEACRARGHHRGDAVVEHASGIEALVGVEPVEEHHRRHRQHRDVDALAIHACDLGVDVMELGKQRRAVVVVAHQCFVGAGAAHRHAEVARPLADRLDHGPGEHMAVHVDHRRLVALHAATPVVRSMVVCDRRSVALDAGIPDHLGEASPAPRLSLE